MDIAAQMEHYSEAFLFAVAAAAGFALAKPVPDTDSVDWTISAGDELRRRPKLDLQLKATAQDVRRDEHLVFRLPKKNYDDLRVHPLLVPRLLLVVIVPENVGDWLTQSEGALAMSHCGYWMSLRDLPESEHDSVTVHVPRANRWDRDALIRIMARIDADEPIDGVRP